MNWVFPLQSGSPIMYQQRVALFMYLTVTLLDLSTNHNFIFRLDDFTS